MLQALLRGKLSQKQENSQDILTSSVFGLLAYLPPAEGLIPFLRLAKLGDGAADPLFAHSDLQIVTTEFWPTYSTEFCASTEPDVLIRAREPNGSAHLIVVEVKLRSQKSSADPGEPRVSNQLARDWCVLTELCNKENASPHLLYVTADLEYPRVDVNESAREFSAKCSILESKNPFRCSWLSWLTVADAFGERAVPALRDISLACRKLGLVPFRGFSTLKPMLSSWSFAEIDDPFQFRARANAVEWSYRQ